MSPAPVIPLEVVQMGMEATRGTGVAATTVLDMDPGGATLTRNPTIIRIRNAGSLATSHRTYPGRDVIQVDISGVWTYNWGPNWLNLILGPLNTGTGASADKTWTFGSAVVSDTADNLKSCTLELGGKDTWPSEYQVKGCVVTKFDLAIRQDQPWRFKVTLLGTAVTPQAKTAALSYAATIVDVLGPGTKVYLNGTGSAFGATQKTGDVLSADLSIDIGANARYTLDGARNPTRIAVTSPRKISCKVVAEYDVQTDYTAVHAATPQRLRLEAIGPTLGGSAYKSNFDIPGVWDTFAIGKDGDVITEEMQLTAQYDTTPGADINAVVVNSTAALL
jgi:hypothetical protein